MQPNWERLKAQLAGASAKDGSRPAEPDVAGQRGASPSAKDDGPAPLTDLLAVDCEMVGVGPDGERSALARVVVVNAAGRKVYDALVRPRERVTDYRTFVTGLVARDLSGAAARDFFEVQKEVAELTRGRTLVGHALHNDLAALMLTHPKHLVRDTSQYAPLRTVASARAGKPGKSRPRALRKLAAEVLGMEIQSGAHDPAEDAIASLRLYQRYQKEWERALRAGPERRAAMIKGARVKKRSKQPLRSGARAAGSGRGRERGTSGREPRPGARPKASAAHGSALDDGGHAARVQAALPAPRPVSRAGTKLSRPAFLH